MRDDDESSALRDAPRAPQSDAVDAPSRTLVGWLLGLNGSVRGKAIPLYDGKTLVGSSHRCEIVLPPFPPCREYCMFRYEADNIILIKLDAAAAIRVNRHNVEKMELIDGDELSLCGSRFKLHYVDADASD